MHRRCLRGRPAINSYSRAILRSGRGRLGATPWFNHQGQAQIVSIAIRSPRSYSGKVEATPWFRTWFSVDPQPASISPTVNISIVFICALLNCGRIIHLTAIKNELRLPNNVHPKHVHAASRYERTAILARSCEAGRVIW